MNNTAQRHSILRNLLISQSILFLVFLVTFLLLDSVLGIKLLHPGFLGFYLLLPVYWFFLYQQIIWKIQLHNKYNALGRTRMLWLRFNPAKYVLQQLAFSLFIYFTVLSAAQPVIGSEKVKGAKRVLDLAICLDISNSMNVKDMSGNQSRLTAAKNAILDLCNHLKGERIAVIIFANDAYVQLPLTMDYGAAKLFVPDISTDMLTDQGTNIGNALALAQTQFLDDGSAKSVLVITDGEDHEAVWQEQIEVYKEKEIELAYLGLGTSKGGLIPNDPDDPASGYKKNNGSAVVSAIDKNGLSEMAKASGSSLAISSSAFPDIVSLAQEFKNAKKKSMKKLEFKVDKNYFYLPLSFGLIAFLVYLFIPTLYRWKEQ